MQHHRDAGRLLTALALAGTALSTGAARPARGQQVAESWTAVFDELRRVAPRSDRVAEVQGLVLERDVARFTLAGGRLYLLSSVAGRTIGAAFVGTGTLSLTPPLEVERGRLRRLLGDSTVNSAITSAVFLFADTTLAELERRLTFGNGAVDGSAADRVGSALDFLADGRARRADQVLMSALLNGESNGWFAAYVRRTRGEDLMLRINPLDAEEIQLLRRGQIEGQRTELLCQFQRAADIRYSVSAGEELPHPLHAVDYRIESRIGGNYQYSARTTIRLEARDEAGPWLLFDLFSELEIDSVVAEDGTPLPFHRADRNPELWVRAAARIAAGSSHTIRFVYHGRLISFGRVTSTYGIPTRVPNTLDNWAFIRSSWNWFPRYGGAEPSRMDLTFRTPRGMRFASVGRLADSTTERDDLVTHWVTESPTRVASFNIGDLEQFDITDPRIPPVTVLYNRDAHVQIRATIPSATRPEEHVGADIVNSLSFFSTRFGPPLFQRYYATEIPYSHGQAFPGLIHLSWWTFLGLSDRGDDESFRAHEMAHQWWGIGVEPATYRDWWLAEGFSEFSGLWYMQLALGNNDNYFRQLRESRVAIRRQRERAAPIALGPRAAESPDGNYQLMIYQKGAWVLHMLRNLMLDTRTMSDSSFGQMMKDFYTTYRGRRATTEDFQRVVERHLNAPMGWFFRQWVHGTDVPRYVFSWRTERGQDGRHVLRYRVRQEDAPEDFMMLVPMLIRFSGDREAIVRVAVRGSLSEGQFAMPEQPQVVELNPLESVLAEVSTERYR